jgi:hypothetical protein
MKVCTSSPESSCSEVQPPFQDLDKRLFSAGRIYFTLTITCESEALSFLAANDYLPVNVAVWRNGTRQDNDIPIGITQQNWAVQSSALRGLAASQGGFPWRTYFDLQLAKTRSIDIQISSSRDAFVLFGTEPARLHLSFAN